MNFQDLIDADAPLLYYGEWDNIIKLNGLYWIVEEDESDGYRSYLGAIVNTELGKNYNQSFSPYALGVVRIRTIARSKTLHNEDFEGYQLVDIVDGHVWCEFGTDYGYAYYPNFRCGHYPKERPILMNGTDEDRKKATQVIAVHIRNIFKDKDLSTLSRAEILAEISKVAGLVAQELEIKEQLGEE